MNKIYTGKEPEIEEKLRNGGDLFACLPIIVLIILRLLDLPIQFDSVIYNWEQYTYSVVDGVDMTQIMSIPKLAIAFGVMASASLVSIYINKRTKYDTIKIPLATTESKFDIIYPIFMGLVYFFVYGGGCEIGLFATGKSTRYWQIYKVFVPEN